MRHKCVCPRARYKRLYCGHGVIIKKGFHEATYLPQVWEEIPDKELFLSSLCLKAQLPADAWKKEKLEVKIYEVENFKE